MPRTILRLLAAVVLAQAAVLLVDPGLLMVESFWMSTSGQLGAVAKSILGGLALVYGAREARFSTFLKVHGGLSILFGVVYALLPHAMWQDFARFMFADLGMAAFGWSGAALASAAFALFWLYASGGSDGTSAGHPAAQIPATGQLA